MTRYLISLFVILLLTGCLPQAAGPASEADQARTALVDFLTLLNTGRYEEAVPLYGGEYEALQVFNTQIDPADHLALWS